MNGICDMRDFLNVFLDRFDYPSKAKEALVSCFDAMASDEKAAKVMKEMLANSKNITIAEPVVTIRSAMNESTKEQLEQLAEAICKA